MSNRRQVGAAHRPQHAFAPAGADRAELATVPDEPVPGDGAGAFEAPFKWGMVYLLARVFYAVRDRTEEMLKPHNLTPMQFTIVASLARWKGLNSAELSRRFKVTPQTMSEMIVNLERRGLIVRRADPSNRRALKLDLTDQGQALVEACNEGMRKMELDLFSAFSPPELHDLRERLTTLHEHMGLKSR